MSDVPIGYVGKEEFRDGEVVHYIHSITPEAGDPEAAQAGILGVPQALLLGVSSDSGGVEVMTIATVTDDTPADQDCRSFLVWTPDAQVYLNIGAAADANDPLLPADVILPMPFNNTSLAHFYNAAGGNATVYVVWRS